MLDVHLDDAWMLLARLDREFISFVTQNGEEKKGLFNEFI